MKITRSDGSVVEGTPEEVAQYEAFARFHGGPSSGLASSQAPEVDWEFVSEDVGFRALTRLKLADKMKTVLRSLYKADRNWTDAKTLQGLTGYTPAQFAGLMGAFGRRIANTAGYVRDSSFFEYELDDGLSCYLYRLPKSSRAAIERARVAD